MFLPITKKAQYFLLGEFLGIAQEDTLFEDEIDELISKEYLNADLTPTKRGQAYCHVQNKVGVNFKSLTDGQSRKANIKLAEHVIRHIAQLDTSRTDLKRLANKLLGTVSEEDLPLTELVQ